MRLFVAIGTLVLCSVVQAETYKVAWSHYVGWEPWGYAAEHGIIDKWANKHGIEIEVELINDYIESINLYTAGEYIACTGTINVHRSG